MNQPQIRNNHAAATTSPLILIVIALVVGGIVKHEFLTWSPFGDIKQGTSMGLVEKRLGEPLSREAINRPR